MSVISRLVPEPKIVCALHCSSTQRAHRNPTQLPYRLITRWYAGGHPFPPCHHRVQRVTIPYPKIPICSIAGSCIALCILSLYNPSVVTARCARYVNIVPSWTTLSMAHMCYVAMLLCCCIHVPIIPQHTCMSTNVRSCMLPPPETHAGGSKFFARKNFKSTNPKSSKSQSIYSMLPTHLMLVVKKATICISIGFARLARFAR